MTLIGTDYDQKLKDFNTRFLVELDRYDAKMKHLSSGHGGRRPNFRMTLLKDCRDDIRLIGLDATIEKWTNFCSNIPDNHIPESKTKAKSVSGKGRPALNIPLNLIYDTLKNSTSIKEAANTLGCSRTYIYREAGVNKVRALIEGK